MTPNLQLHHFGLLVKDIEKASIRYVRSFGYQIYSAVIHDPLQTAFVRFLVLPEERTFLELISPDGPASLLQNALKKNGGIHHVCYATRDIADSIDHLRENGSVVISEPKPAVAFNQRKIAWLMTPDHLLLELVEQGNPGEL